MFRYSHKNIPATLFPRILTACSLLAFANPFLFNNTPASAAQTTGNAPVIAAVATAAAAQWIWFPEKPADKTTRYFRKTITIDAPIESAIFHFAADDFAFFYLDNKLANPAGFGIGDKKGDLTRQLRQGINTLTFQVNNSGGAAGLLVYGEIIYKDKRIQRVTTDATWDVSNDPPADLPPPPPGATRPPASVTGETITWQPARIVGTPDSEPWVKLVTPALYKDQGPITRVPIPPQNLGLVMLDDFSDVSSWLGGPTRGHPPGSGRPFPFSFGSAANADRDDGYHGEFVFHFTEPGGQARFEKNAVLLLKAMPYAIEFDANPLGHEADIAFEFIDKRNRLFRSNPVRLAGNEWRHHRIEITPDTFPDCNDILFPVALRYIHFTVLQPAEGKILIDNIACEADVTRHGGPLQVRPDYTGINHEPGKPVILKYRVRNRQAASVTSEWKLDVHDANGRKVTTRRASLSVPGHALAPLTFDVASSLPTGPYRTELSVAGTRELSHFGWFGVFTPNARRINKNPMWFAVEDQEIHSAPGEASLHAGWMRALGIDLVRSGMEGWMLENTPGVQTGFDGYSRLLQPYFDANINILLDYAGHAPGWTRSRNPPPGEFAWDPERLREHMTSIGQFIARHPRIKYFEFINEPDLPHRPPHLTLNNYLDGLRIVYQTLKAYAPELKVTTGGVAFGHGRATPGFSEGMYREGKNYYDIAAFHCHASPEEYANTQNQIKRVLVEAGKNVPLGQTEAGARSYQREPSLFISQAEVLVKKLALAKSAGSEFYVWFMLQDYWDKYINADDSFGLVTVDNQPKPSFVAYNELIRQLANTHPVPPPLQLDPRLETHHYQNDTEDIFVCWPRNRQSVTLALSTTVPVTYINIWGHQQRLSPVQGIINHVPSPLPFYLRAPRGAITPAKPLANAVGDTVLAPGETRPLSVEVNNPVNARIRGSFSTGKETHSIDLAPLESKKIRIPMTAPADAAVGPQNLRLAAQISTHDGKAVYTGDINIPYDICLRIPRQTSPGAQVKNVPVPDPRIITETVSWIRELAFDPHTPRWAGPDDLSARIHITWDNDGLRIRAQVRDQDICFPRDNEYTWLNDCLQIAILGAKDEQTEITLTKDSKGKTTIWSFISSKQSLTGRWDIPAIVETSSGQIDYDITIPFERIGLRGERGESFKMSLAIVDNDGGRRLRVIEWGGGIQDDKNPDRFHRVRLD